MVWQLERIVKNLIEIYKVYNSINITLPKYRMRNYSSPVTKFGRVAILNSNVEHFNGSYSHILLIRVPIDKKLRPKVHLCSGKMFHFLFSDKPLNHSCEWDKGCNATVRSQIYLIMRLGIFRRTAHLVVGYQHHSQ